MEKNLYVASMKACITRAEESESVEEQYFVAGYFECLMKQAVNDPEVDVDVFESYIGLRSELFDLVRRLNDGVTPQFVHYAVSLEGEIEK